MKEIKFRAWQGGRFHYWGFIKSSYGDDYEFHAIADTNAEPLSMTEKMARSQQYTGLKDKNGVEIYEEDIVTHPLCVKEPHEGNESCETFIGRISFEVDQGQYFAVNNTRNGYVIVMSEAYKFEVIGNIYENKELLK